MFDFPASPSEDQVFTPAGGPSYVFKSPAWRVSSPAIPILKDARRNRIVNGAMQISQENGITAVTADGAYIADQWMLQRSSSSTISANKGTAAAGNATPDIVGSISVSASPAETAAAASEYVMVNQNIEGLRIGDLGWGGAQSKQAILAFSVYIPVAGTYWVAINNLAATHCFLGSYTISAGELNTWVRKEIVIPVGAVNAGVWANTTAQCCFLRFTFHCGSNLIGVAGFQAGNKLAGPGQALGLSTAGACVLSNVGLYLDADNSGVPPRWEMPDEAQELVACQRYYQQVGAEVVGRLASATAAFVACALRPHMRVAPAGSRVASGATSGLGVAGQTSFDVSSLTIDVANVDCVIIAATIPSTAVAVGAVITGYNNNWCALSARM